MRYNRFFPLLVNTFIGVCWDMANWSKDDPIRLAFCLTQMKLAYLGYAHGWHLFFKKKKNTQSLHLRLLCIDTLVMTVTKTADIGQPDRVAIYLNK